MAKKKKEFDEITLILIVAAAALLISFFGREQPAVQEIGRISKIVLNNPGIEGSGVIDEKKLMEISSMDYDSLKKSLKTSRDFCIYIEDDNGNILLSKSAPSLNKGRFCVA
ncbi:MAG TPA: hypothetical protein VJI97_00155 [Candidatus Nanoarchaeia archaeon]|nr:hypothetical protein [Candidatus Nanoarchaeia archaeon]